MDNETLPFVMCTDSHGVNTPSRADFKLPLWHHGAGVVNVYNRHSHRGVCSPLEGIQGPTLGQTHRTQAYMSTHKKRRCLSGRGPLRDLTSILGTLGGRKVHHPDPRGAAVMRCREPSMAASSGARALAQRPSY